MRDEINPGDLSRYSQIRATNTRPREKTDTSLPSGRWCLSTLSSVPYVRLTGPGGFQKEFSWGEVIEVPEGTDGVLENTSFHVGDIVLNGGHDWAAVPARITVPVLLGTLNAQGRFVQLPEGFPGAPLPLVFPVTVVPSWGVDTRRARRAFLALEWETADLGDDPPVIAEDLTFLIRGYAEQRSHGTVDSIVAVPGIGYETEYVAPAGTRFGIIPLGYSASNGLGGEPHALLDFCKFEVLINANFFNIFKQTAYYIVEY